MSDISSVYILAGLVAVIAAISIYLSPKAEGSGAFFSGLSPNGDLWALTAMTAAVDLRKAPPVPSFPIAGSPIVSDG